MRYNLNTGRRFNVEQMGTRAEKLKIYTVEAGTSTHVMYALADGEVGIINRGGAIRLDLRDAKILCKELPQIIEEFNTYVRDGRRI